MKKISVCIATYNGAKYINAQLQSILVQLSDFDEVIISDDFSIDDTIFEITKLNDDRVKIFYNEKAKGYSKNFENALEKASGDIIFLADQDDVWLDNKVDICVKELEKYDFVVHDGIIVNSQLKTISESIFSFRSVKKGFFSNFFSIKYLGCSMAFNSYLLKKALPFPNNSEFVTHDSWLTLVSELYFSTSLIHKKLFMYRRHGNNTSLGGGKGTNSFLKKLKIRIYSIFHLALIYIR